MPRTSETIQNFRDYATAWQGATISIVAAGAVAILRSMKKTPDEVVDELRASVAETGVKTAQIYRYVGIAKALAARITKQEDEGPIDDLMSAATAHDATERLVELLDEAHVRSVDQAAVYLNTYKRTPKKAAAKQTERRPAAAEKTSVATIRSVVTRAAPAKVAAAYVKAPEDFLAMATELAAQIESPAVLREITKVFNVRLDELLGEPPTRRTPETRLGVFQ